MTGLLHEPLLVPEVEQLVTPPGPITQVLRRAYQLLEQGWCQGQYHREHFGRHHYCMVGAIVAVARHSITRHQATQRVAAVLASPMIVAWNDTPGRSKEEVLAVMANAIEDAETEGA